jgi:hypothetical protein
MYSNVSFNVCLLNVMLPSHRSQTDIHDLLVNLHLTQCRDKPEGNDNLWEHWEQHGSDMLHSEIKVFVYGISMPKHRRYALKGKCGKGKFVAVVKESTETPSKA